MGMDPNQPPDQRPGWQTNPPQGNEPPTADAPGYPPPYTPQGAPGYPPAEAPGYPQQPQGGYAPPPPPGYYGAPYGQPPAGYGAPAAAAYAAGPTAPAGLGGLWQKFVHVTTKPSAQSFAAELPTQNWRDIWLALLGLGVLSAITTFIASLYIHSNVYFANNPGLSQLTPDQRARFEQIFNSIGQVTPGLAIGRIITVPLSFFIGMGIYFVFAKLFGGKGTFLEQSYAFMLFTVPLQALAAIVALVPFLGGLVSFAIGIYSIILGIFAMMASQRLTGGRATMTVLLPVIIALILVCGLIVTLAIIIASALQPR